MLSAAESEQSTAYWMGYWSMPLIVGVLVFLWLRRERDGKPRRSQTDALVPSGLTMAILYALSAFSQVKRR